VAALKAEVDRIEQEKNEALAAKDQQVTELQTAAQTAGEESSKARVERQQIVRDNEIAMERLRRDNRELQDKIEELKPGGFDAYNILQKADGRIVRAVPGSDVVYIDIGRQDRVRPGLGFEVFSPEGDRQSGVAGKARVEVTTVLDNTSECRVTRSTPGAPIVEGDAIINIAYERNRRPKFVIRGEFDLDYNGEADVDGTEKVTALIREWGGQVVAEIDETPLAGVGPFPRRG
jgi:hypothetical protein